MLRKSLGVFGLSSAIVISGAASIWAAVPANVIRGWQESAPEALSVTVLSKEETSATLPFGTPPGGTVTTTHVTVTSRVDSVQHTASGLAQGSVIVVQYEIVRYQPPPGPPDAARGIVLNVGEKATAYLKQADGKNYQLSCAVGCLVKL